LLIEDEYYDFKEDVREEAAKMGDLRSIEIPRPINDQDKRPHIGRVFLEYSTVDDARSARSVSLKLNYSN
jgi:splicing factor U2AF subunit